MKTACLCNG